MIYTYNEINQTISEYEQRYGLLNGIIDEYRRACFIKQMIDSIRRIVYIERIKARRIDKTCIDPKSNSFNPLKALDFGRKVVQKKTAKLLHGIMCEKNNQCRTILP